MDIVSVGWHNGTEENTEELEQTYLPNSSLLENFPHLKLWFERMMARPAVIKGVSIGAGINHDLSKDLEAQKILFGQKARD